MCTNATPIYPKAPLPLRRSEDKIDREGVAVGVEEGEGTGDGIAGEREAGDEGTDLLGAGRQDQGPGIGGGLGEIGGEVLEEGANVAGEHGTHGGGHLEVCEGVGRSLAVGDKRVVRRCGDEGRFKGLKGLPLDETVLHETEGPGGAQGDVNIGEMLRLDEGSGGVRRGGHERGESGRDIRDGGGEGDGATKNTEDTEKRESQTPIYPRLR